MGLNGHLLFSHSQFMLFKEIIEVYSQNHTKPTNTLFGWKIRGTTSYSRWYTRVIVSCQFFFKIFTEICLRRRNPITTHFSSRQHRDFHDDVCTVQCAEQNGIFETVSQTLKPSCKDKIPLRFIFYSDLRNQCAQAVWFPQTQIRLDRQIWIDWKS